LIVDLVLNDVKAYVERRIVDCSIAVDDGKIFKIGREPNMPHADAKTSLDNLLVLPGLIDIHVHLRDEGKASKEDFFSGTAAAAAGGMTTVFDMPNNDPVTMSVETLRNRIRIAEKKALVNVGFYSEFPSSPNEIRSIVEAGAIGFKLFMANQIGGLDIGDDHALLRSFKAVSDVGVPTAVHAEDEEMLRRNKDKLRRAGRHDLCAFLEVHTEDAEIRAISRLLGMVKLSKMHLHFCHVSTKAGLEAIIAGRKSGLPVSYEVTPHHLFLSIDDLRRIGMFAVTMPPIREKHNSEALLNNVRKGWVGILASDHAPHTLEEKDAETVWDVKVGIPGLETTLPLLLSEVHRKTLMVGDVVRLMSENPAELFKLRSKGYLKEGNDADLTVVDIYQKHRIETSTFHSKAKYSPFEGRVVTGKPVKTFVNGELIMDDGIIVAKAGSGQIIRGH
jgi:dihydroorotase (multifunctional complex type)